MGFVDFVLVLNYTFIYFVKVYRWVWREFVLFCFFLFEVGFGSRWLGVFGERFFLIYGGWDRMFCFFRYGEGVVVV